jgi:hypothetical protein
MKNPDSNSNINKNNNLYFDMKTFISHIPSNGGFFLNKNGSKVNMINTCTIDNYLFALWYLSKIMPSFHNRIANINNKTALMEVIENIEIHNWDFARQLWFTKIMKLDFRNRKGAIDFFGSVENFFLQYMYDFQIHNVIQNCTRNCKINGKIIHSKSEILNLGKKGDEVTLLTDIYNMCPECENIVSCNFVFLHNPIFIFIETSDILFIQDLPKQLNISNKIYRLLSMVIYRAEKQHFISVIEIEDKFYLIDDLSPNKAELLTENDNINYFAMNVSSALYYLE